jgi:hypothetical protein
MMNSIFLLDFAGAASASAPLAGAFPFVAIYCSFQFVSAVCEVICLSAGKSHC